MTVSYVTAARTEPPGAHHPQPARPPGLVRLLVWARPLWFTAMVAGAVTVVAVPAYDPASPRFEYALRATAVGLVLVGAAGWWWAHRRGWSWGADLAPALLGGIGALTLVGSLHGTPYAPGGLAGDQSFRTAAITRFADTWHNADFTFQGLPSFYAPGYFWVLGRAADLAGIEPWRMAKYGTVLAALLVPVLTYLLWRRLVPMQVAALIAAVPLVVENVYEPYAWLVVVAIVPWWLETVHGIRRPGRQPGHPLLLGLIGGLLFLTYYYFFFIAALALLLHLVVEQVLGRLRWRQVRRLLPGAGAGRSVSSSARKRRRTLSRPAARRSSRPGSQRSGGSGERARKRPGQAGPQLGRAVLALSVAAAVSAVFWLPLVRSLREAAEVESLANRWFQPGHSQVPLPMLELSPAGLVAVLGLGYLVWTVRREPLSRGLLVLLVAAYGWYLIGAPAAVADAPLLSFRGRPLVPLILLTAGVLALAQLARLAADRLPAADVRRMAWATGLVLMVYVGQAFVGAVRDSPLTEQAHATAWPDGRLPAYPTAGAAAPQPSAAILHQDISQLLSDVDRPVLLSDRVDIMVLYPYYGFIGWNAHYAHPASEFHARIRFLDRLTRIGDSADFSARSAGNRFDRIDAFVLRDEGDELVLRYAEDAFPAGSRTAEIRFPRELFSDRTFHLIRQGEHVLAVRRSAQSEPGAPGSRRLSG